MPDNISREASPSPSLLFYLFADKLLPVVQYKLGLPVHLPQGVPCKDVSVGQFQLAELLVAVAFWNLRERELISLETHPARKLLIIPMTAVRVATRQVTARQMAASQSVAPLSLDAAIVAALEVGHDGQDVHPIIRAIAGKSCENPHQEYIWRVSGEAGATGLMDEKQFNCQRIAALEARADDYFGRWRSFQSNETRLYDALLKSCKIGIKSLRAEQPRSSRDGPPGNWS